MSNLSKVQKIVYTAQAKVHGGREGHVESNDGMVKLDLRLPKEMGGNGGGSNPEQLFAAGYAACFEGAIRFVAGQKNVKLNDVSVEGHVGIGPREGSGFAIQVKLDAHLAGLDDATAQDIVKTAHEDVCPYSHATRGNVDVDVSVNGKALA
ncbi:organic hydroperoxide resistance protein [Luteibacter sp. PPL201]|jgi:Ohr subfamily peroxiredoxin|uniref:Organic hydroperoxide resistance protein n=1 Tax=Luteibacter sahnii TaxID=3021977 RepID=A0ABT6BB40_9GAMM|nr:organic hydroperoxide resistance protein [Luteibacter sp. PPL193]MDY1547326.1 organic hydroperoxide resistance protein [Luteibacter sp. PPL193]